MLSALCLYPFKHKLCLHECLQVCEIHSLPPWTESHFPFQPHRCSPAQKLSETHLFGVLRRLYYVVGHCLNHWSLYIELNLQWIPPLFTEVRDFSSAQFSRSVVSDSLRPRGLQHTSPPCPSPTPGACSNSCPPSRWCQPTISSPVVPFSSCPQCFPASGSFPIWRL